MLSLLWHDLFVKHCLPVYYFIQYIVPSSLKQSHVPWYSHLLTSFWTPDARCLLRDGTTSMATSPYLIFINDVSDIIIIKLSWYSLLKSPQIVHFWKNFKIAGHMYEFQDLTPISGHFRTTTRPAYLRQNDKIITDTITSGTGENAKPAQYRP